MPIRITGMNSGLDTESIIKDLVSAYDKKTETFKKQKTKMEWKQDAWKSLNSKIYSFYTKQLGNMRFLSSYNRKASTISDTSKATVSASSDAVIGTQTLKVKELAQTAYLTGSAMKAKDAGVDKITGKTELGALGIEADFSLDVEVNGETKSLSFGVGSTINDVVNSLKSAGLTASFDEKNQRFFVSGKDSGEKYDFTISSSNSEAIKALGLLDKDNGGNAVKIEGKNALIELNGAEFESNTNNFSINGLNITAHAKTGDTTLNITTNVDAQGIYDSIKGFLKEYNELIKEMDKLFNADAAKKMEPLTDEEKDAMSEEEVKKWETKIKDALLRRDDTLGSLTDVLKTAMAKTYTVNGKQLNLSSFGISTGSYMLAGNNEKGVYHIAGDKDDTDSASKADKLLAAINEDPDTIADFFSQLVTGAYKALDTKMKSTSLNSAYTVYNDKQMTADMTAMDKKISNWEDKVAKIEDKYYKQFAAMEKALAELQSKQSSLGQLFGN